MSAPGGPQSLQRSTSQQNPDPRRGRKKAPNAAKGPQNSGNAPRSKPSATSQPNPRRSQQKGNDKGAKNHTKAPFNKEKTARASKQPAPVTDAMEEDGFVQPKRMAKVAADALPQYSAKELSATGTIFPDPARLGFMKAQQRKPRPVPRYMLNQPRLLSAPGFKQDVWDKENQQKMIAMEEANNGSDFQGIYEEFQRMREVERKKMEELGLVDAENITKDLNDAIFFQGTCLDMCPSFERVRRSLENNVKSFEKDPATQRIARERAVKAFSRPAAGQPPPMPSDVRPPHVLMKTLDYIVDHILPQLPEAHSFIWDRTRSIRQDFIYQNYYGPEAIDCNERIVRIHLISLHVMAGCDVEYSQQQELEQFNKALQTLTESYQDVRNHGGISPNEAEFRAYHLISHFRDPELEREIQTLPDAIYKSHIVQLALRFRNIMSQNNIVERGYINTIGAANLFVEFFRLTYHEETPLLLACLLETHFNEIRFYALKSLSRSYHTKGKAFSGESLRKMLGFDSMEKLVRFVSYYEVDTFEEDGQLLVDLCNKEKLEAQYKLNSLRDKPKLAQAFSLQLEERRNRQSLSSVVNSGLSNSDLRLKHTSGEVVQIPALSNRSSQPAAKPSAFGQPFNAPQPFATPSGPTQNPPFGSSTQSIGFGKTAPSFTNATSSNQAPFGSITAAQTTAPFGQPAGFSPAPAFDFKSQGKQPSNDASLGTAPTVPNPASTGFGLPEAAEPSAATPTFNFASQVRKPTESINFRAPAIAPQTDFKLTNDYKEKEKEKTPDEKKSEGKENKIGTVQKSVSSTNTSFSFQTTPQPAKIEKIPIPSKPAAKLSSHCHFANASGKVASSLVTKCVEEELQKILPRMVQQRNKSQERSRVIDALASELFSAFLSEVTYQTTLRSVAKVMYEKKLKRKAFEQIRRASGERKANNSIRKIRLEELQAASFKVPSLKRKHADTSNESFTKKQAKTTQADMTYEEIHDRREEIQKLWEPLDLQALTNKCSDKAETLTDKKPSELKCLLIVENWASPYSKWLNTKFSLNISTDKTHYENTVGGENLNLCFQSLPKANSIDQKSFQNTAFVVFECGLHEEQQVAAYKNLGVKLNRDRGILEKILKICDRFCLYKYQVILLVWDITNCGMPAAEMKARLSVKGASEDSIVMCDMSRTETNVAKVLDTGMQKLAANFTGQLSRRGQAKKIKFLQQKEEESRKLDASRITDGVRASERKLKAKEEEILRRARELQKRRYLSEHVTGNQSVDLSDQSMAFRTPNGSFNTSINYNTTNYNTLVGNNSFVANTSVNARDTSFLKSFGNASFLEESTPWGSPRPSFSKPALPKKVQELKSLAASIRARYKK